MTRVLGKNDSTSVENPSFNWEEKKVPNFTHISIQTTICGMHLLR
jgi:hypothetical protein